MSCVKGIQKVERMGSDSLMGHFAVGGQTVHHTVGSERYESSFSGGYPHRRAPCLLLETYMDIRSSEESVN